MTYQLVIQRKASSLEDFDNMVDLENEIIGWLGNADEVDGHDFGSGTANIFVITDRPEDMFTRLSPILHLDQTTNLRVAFRPLNGNTYTVLWPEGDTTEFTL